MVTSEIRESFHARFVQIPPAVKQNASEIIP